MIHRLAALFVKELRTLFASPIAYIVLTSFVSLSGVYFFQHILAYNRLLFVIQSEAVSSRSFDAGTIPIHVNALNDLFIPLSNDFSLFLLAVVPLITMRVFAEERAQGTDELLLTTPLRSWEVVLAKYATTFFFVLLILAASAIYPTIVVNQSGLGIAHLLTLYFGLFAYGTAIAAIGLACSSLTQSQIVAAILAYAIPFIFLDFSWLEPALSENVAGFMRTLALQTRFEGFARGVIELRNLLYFGGAVVIGFTVSLSALELSRAR